LPKELNFWLKIFINLILTVSNPYKYHSFSFIFHLASSLALKGGDSTEREAGLGGGGFWLKIFINLILLYDSLKNYYCRLDTYSNYLI
jgi:hypothetical protein